MCHKIIILFQCSMHLRLLGKSLDFCQHQGKAFILFICKKAECIWGHALVCTALRGRLASIPEFRHACGPWILVQPPGENGQNVPASGCLWFLEGSWMSRQTTAASSSQAPARMGSIPRPAPGLQPGIVLPAEWCKSSAMCSYPCLLNGLKTVENREIIFYFNDQKGVAHYSQPTHMML